MSESKANEWMNERRNEWMDGWMNKWCSHMKAMSVWALSVCAFMLLLFCKFCLGQIQPSSPKQSIPHSPLLLLFFLSFFFFLGSGGVHHHHFPCKFCLNLKKNIISTISLLSNFSVQIYLFIYLFNQLKLKLFIKKIFKKILPHSFSLKKISFEGERSNTTCI